ncbi:hypothetical protein ACS5PU_21690 [Pedobacter sp. GSP4]|uniref:hypothetical protein n=1 Tax=Pedobacter sp. GSP4 TaxID=3453716 RepID=UPI003EE8CEA7
MTKSDELGSYRLSPNGDVVIFNAVFSEDNSPCKIQTIFFDKIIIRFLSDLFERKYTRYDDNRDATSGLDHQISHYTICLYLEGYKDKAIAVAEKIISDAIKRQNENRVSISDESVLIHNYTSLKKHLQDDKIVELYGYHTNKCAEIKFD